MKTSRMRDVAIAIGFAFATATSSSAHDFWIEPETFRPTVGATLNVALRVGEDFAGQPVKRNSARIQKFMIAGSDGETPVPGVDGDDPAGSILIKSPGVHVLGYRSNHSSIELAPDKFESYLKEEGLLHVAEFRKRRGESDKPGREIYSRCAKSIVSVKPSADDKNSPSGEAAKASSTAKIYERSLGFTFEIIPLKDPTELKPGDELQVKLVFEGTPDDDVQVAFRSKADPNQPVIVRTNSEGIAVAKLNQPGEWLIASVHMIRSGDESVADWESFWASLTFEIASGEK